MKIAAWWLLAAGTLAPAQPLTVYSEFARIDAKGKVFAPANPREILSPALPRNAYSSFQVVVEAPEGTAWELYIAQNPENAVRPTLYRVSGERLERVAEPARGSGTQVFWMDLFAEKSATVERIKIEPQLHIENDWVIYPIEGRIVEATVPDGTWPTGSASPGDVMRGFLCGTAAQPGEAPKDPTQASLRFRNAQQDRAMAGKADKARLQERFGACDAQPPADNPEWYFRVRDYLVGAKQ